MKRKIVTTILVLSMLLCSIVQVSAVSTNSSLTFSDVPSTHWAYKTIMSMVDKGLFSGTTTPVNGVGRFEPDKYMTKAEFITVVVRYLYPSTLSGMKQEKGSAWYSTYYNVAVKKGILNADEFNNGTDLDKAMTREEMAMVLVRALHAQDLNLGLTLMPRENIPDYESIDKYYCFFVQECYANGLITGVDGLGTFNPKGVLTRAQASTVLYRLIEPSERVSVDLTKKNTDSRIQSNVGGGVANDGYEQERDNPVVNVPPANPPVIADKPAGAADFSKPGAPVNMNDGDPGAKDGGYQVGY